MSEPVKISVTFNEQKLVHTMRPPVVRDSTVYHDYDGPYAATPSVESYELETTDKHLEENIVIEKIPFSLVSNLKGYTAIIGD